MSALALSANSSSPDRLGHANLDIYRGHAFSFLVAVSVLLGSMFAAHSAIVELASVNTGHRLMAMVEEIRTEISQIPVRASQHMAAVGALDRYCVGSHCGYPAYERFSFSSGMEGLFAPYISLVSYSDPELAQGPQIIENYGSVLGFDADIDPIAAPVKAAPYAPLVSNALWVAAEPYIAISEALLAGISTIEDRATVLYIESIYAWVGGSQFIAKTTVLTAYTFGNSTIHIAAKGIPSLELERMPVLTIWATTANELARMLVEPQVAIGGELIETTTSLRMKSAATQAATGEEISQIALGITDAVSQLVGDLPKTATASVADFLILKEK